MSRKGMTGAVSKKKKIEMTHEIEEILWENPQFTELFNKVSEIWYTDNIEDPPPGLSEAESRALMEDIRKKTGAILHDDYLTFLQIINGYSDNWIKIYNVPSIDAERKELIFAITNDQGNWDAGNLPSGVSYRFIFDKSKMNVYYRCGNCDYSSCDDCNPDNCDKRESNKETYSEYHSFIDILYEIFGVEDGYY